MFLALICLAIQFSGKGGDTTLSYGVFFLLPSALTLAPLLYSRRDLRFVELVGVFQMLGTALAILLTHLEVF